MRIPIPSARGAFSAAHAAPPAPIAPLAYGPTFPGIRRDVAPPPAPLCETTASHARPPAKPAASPAALYELGVTCAAMGFHESAIEALRDAIFHAPGHAYAWCKLGELLSLAGADEQAAAARAAAERSDWNGTKWPRAKGERSPAKREKAERRLREILRRAPAQEAMPLLREILFRDPTDVTAMRLLARQEWSADDGVTAHCLLERALDLAPDYVAARADFAELLLERRYYVRVLEETERLLAQAPRISHYRTMRADALAQIGRFAEAIALFEDLIGEEPNEPRYWLSYGHALHFVGRRDDSVKAYRTCLELSPAMGDAYWGLSDLKGAFITGDDVAAMRAQLAGGALDASNRMRMFYALAPYHERLKDFPASFEAYEAGAAAFRESVADTPKAHNAEAATDRVRRLKKTFSASLFAARSPAVAATGFDTPIFIIGMPRAGSTLTEQILASHSMVEGTRELPVIGDITRKLMISRLLLTPTAYPECVADLPQDELAALGLDYIEGAAAYRKTTRPYFIDKRPFNWMDAGLIHLILPQAKFIDIRREPMAACFAMYKQMLPADVAFSYDLAALGRYYNEYVSMMQHYETVLPGRILHVSYERLVENTEAEIRRMLDYCDLPFEESCLRFWETERAVATPSAEQVRRPIFRDALEQWRHYEPWLEPLKAALAQPVRC